MYVSRQLSFKDVTFKIDVVPLSPKFIKLYDDSAKMWTRLLETFTHAADLVSADSKMRKTMWTEFWLAHRRFFQQLSLAPKIMQAVKVASEAVKCGKSVVISLQSVLDIELEQTECAPLDFATPKVVLQNLVRKQFPVTIPSGVRLVEKRLPSTSNITINEENSGKYRQLI